MEERDVTESLVYSFVEVAESVYYYTVTTVKIR